MNTIKEAIDDIQKIKWLIDEGPAHVKLTEAQCRLTELKVILSAIDPEAIRRECAEKVEELKKHCTTRYASSYEEGVLDGYNNAIEAILGAEPAREIKACNGCALRNKDNRPCAGCERAAPYDPGLNDYYTPEPAQDEGRPEIGDIVAFSRQDAPIWQWQIARFGEYQQDNPSWFRKVIVLERAADVRKYLEAER